MKKRMSAKSEARGSALVATMGIVLILAMVSVGALSTVLNDSARVSKTEKVTQAAYVASGAMDLFLARAIPDPKLFREGNEGLLAGTVGNGTFTIAIEQVAAQMALVTAQGVHEGNTQTLRAYVETNIWEASRGFDKALFTESNLYWKGTSDVLKGAESSADAHSNGDEAINSGSAVIEGNLTSVGTASDGGGGVTGDVLSGQPRIEWPVLDLSRYTAIAQANGEVVDASKKAYNFKDKASPLKPKGGVIWVKGAKGVQLTSMTEVHGCIIVDGPITVAGGAKLTQRQTGIPMPAIVSIQGDIKIVGHADVQGLVYVANGSVHVGGTMDIEGAIYAWGDLVGAGTPKVTFNPDYLQLDDPDNPAKEVAKLVAIER